MLQYFFCFSFVTLPHSSARRLHAAVCSPKGIKSLDLLNKYNLQTASYELVRYSNFQTFVGFLCVVYHSNTIVPNTLHVFLFFVCFFARHASFWIKSAVGWKSLSENASI